MAKGTFIDGLKTCSNQVVDSVKQFFYFQGKKNEIHPFIQEISPTAIEAARYFLHHTYHLSYKKLDQLQEKASKDYPDLLTFYAQISDIMNDLETIGIIINFNGNPFIDMLLEADHMPTVINDAVNESKVWMQIKHQGLLN